MVLGRDVFVILDVIISFRRRRARRARANDSGTQTAKPQLWSSWFSHGVVELAGFNDNAEREKDKVCLSTCLPAPESQQKQSCCIAHSYPGGSFAALVLHTGGSRNASTPKMSGACRMNTLPFPSATELTCTPCATLPRKCLDERERIL